jgi:chromosomal replication initiator protein
MMTDQGCYPDPAALWEKVFVELQKLISPDACRRWFQPVRPLNYEPGILSLGVENTIYQYWIEENYLPQLRDCLHLITGRETRVSFELLQGQGTAPAPAPEAAKDADSSPKSQPLRTELIARYLFSSFVEGAGNQFARAAASAVAEAPARTYNPLLIHGSVGLGKTHLMHAIGHRILEKNPRARVVYVTSEQFTNEFVSAIQHNELVKFRRRFRQADVLFIDDIQFLGGKERSQEEFFHTFNALFDGNKQIVLSSDAPPSDIKNLEQRLVSRFEWGLTAELQPPDIETRLAILRSKAAKMEVKLGDSILLFIAENIKANIRRLEGALNRVAAWAALNERKITQAQVEDLLKDFIQQENRQQITIELIQRRVVENFDLRMNDMTSKRRPNNIAIPRMVAMYLARKKTGKSLQEIGECFGGRDHGTVLHACRTIEARMEKDSQLKQQVLFLIQKLESNPT